MDTMDCFLCKLKKKENSNYTPLREDVKKFTNVLLTNCQKYKQARWHHKHKYSGADVPKTIVDAEKSNVGYHSTCYKDFKVKTQFLVEARYVNFCLSYLSNKICKYK